MMSKSLRIWFAAVAFSGIALSGAAANPSIAVDVATGKVYEQQDAFQRWYPASLTKMMTAYVTFRALQSGQMTLESPVRMTVNASKEPPSKMGYKPGSIMTLDTALNIMLVKSANDVSVAVAEAVGGTEAAFVQRMNAEARRLGMFGSHFANPNGLHDPNNYTTARDLAVLAVQLRREFPQHAHYFATEAIDPGAGKKVEANYNILLGRYDGADGMKTGFVCASGFNLAGSATRNGRTVLAIVLGADRQETRAIQAAQMMTDAFRARSSGGPTLATLRPAQTANLNQAVDMRKAICSEQAMADRWDGREVEGRLKINSPYIHAMDHDPIAVQVRLVSEPGSINRPGQPGISRVPVPMPRPQRAPGVKTTAIN
ncbi:D-alanyl-D-alanine carboxypeptidase family protein [Brucella suis]|nr:D-alanyl-D-alanine carboxypeptidase family protein [Brucella suis]AIB18538.1 D-alanyl-D-alanine carboxypeptidase [Brucella suis bv. 2]AIB21925.1 D-alanyl-D-alanine carboxypeptidase [Brucella suis bv. 2]AIB25279.1 D-alanyl-D-alanine carboxypeptidase [Brucella suis bv. 2]AIB28672.1 D-alanyl-D-alanine carboxypeptidase [Brucella suis bv. 2]AIB32040.1 D-alanyl-D-alanine carboxypeptidase [Brucella suis bv. 2]